MVETNRAIVEPGSVDFNCDKDSGGWTGSFGRPGNHSRIRERSKRRRPAGWAPHHWAYGQILPRGYWAAPYLIADYWLFALEVPPAGYEWVRDGNDALLIDTNSGEILQVEYGVFA